MRQLSVRWQRETDLAQTGGEPDEILEMAKTYFSG